MFLLLQTSDIRAVLDVIYDVDASARIPPRLFWHSGRIAAAIWNPRFLRCAPGHARSLTNMCVCRQTLFAESQETCMGACIVLFSLQCQVA
jgi:hypothetical protein